MKKAKRNLVVWLKGEYRREIDTDTGKSKSMFYLCDFLGRTVFSYDCSDDYVYPIYETDIKYTPSIGEMHSHDGKLFIRRKKINENGSVSVFENQLYDGYFRCRIESDDYYGTRWKLMTIHGKYNKGLSAVTNECEILAQRIGISHISILKPEKELLGSNKRDELIRFENDCIRVYTISRDLDIERKDMMLTEVWSNHIFDVNFYTQTVNNRLVVQQIYDIKDYPDTWILRMRNTKMVLYIGELYLNPFSLLNLLKDILKMKEDGEGIGMFEGSFFGIGYQYTIRYFPYIWLPEDREFIQSCSRRSEAMARTLTPVWPGFWTENFRFRIDGIDAYSSTHKDM